MEALLSPHFLSPTSSYFFPPVSSCSSPPSRRSSCCHLSSVSFLLSGGGLPVSLPRLSVSPGKCGSCHHPLWLYRDAYGLRARYRRIGVLDGEAATSGELEEETELEDEIYDFMIRSPNPNRFPTASDLIEAGRKDLVQAIAARGGWLCLGWDLDEEGGDADDPGSPGMQAGAAAHAVPEYSSGTPEETEAEHRNRVDSSLDASSSGRPPIGTENSDDDVGVEGILRRLEKERSFSFGLEEIKRRTNSRSSYGCHINGKRPLPGYDKKGSRSMPFDLCDDFCSNFGIASSLPETNFSNFKEKRASQLKIIPSNSDKSGHVNALNDMGSDEKITPGADCSCKSEHVTSIEFGGTQIHLRLRQMELKLKSALALLKSKGAVAPLKSHEDSESELHKLYDKWEFQETEVIKARDMLRSIRAKLAVLEGKMSLKIVEADKIVEEKQKRISRAQRALHLLRTACIIWPNTASEVFLSGSFDGWTSQRRMEKSGTGIFSLYLKLYPGQYEIKFIVDGVWRIDPLRPVVNHSGHENNLIVIL